MAVIHKDDLFGVFQNIAEQAGVPIKAYAFVPHLPNGTDHVGGLVKTLESCSRSIPATTCFVGESASADFAYMDFVRQGLTGDTDEAFLVETKDHRIIVTRAYQNNGAIKVIDRNSNKMVDPENTPRLKKALAGLRKHDIWGSHFDKDRGIGDDGYLFNGLSKDFIGLKKFLGTMLDYRLERETKAA